MNYYYYHKFIRFGGLSLGNEGPSFYYRMKYFAKKVEVDGIVFDSKSEADVYKILSKREDDGEIYGLDVQVPFTILPKLEQDVIVHLKTKDKIVKRLYCRAIKYTADFCYYENGFFVIHEVKSPATMMARDYSLRINLLKRYIRLYNENNCEIPMRFEETVIGKKKNKK